MTAEDRPWVVVLETAQRNFASRLSRGRRANWNTDEAKSDIPQEVNHRLLRALLRAPPAFETDNNIGRRGSITMYVISVILSELRVPTYGELSKHLDCGKSVAAWVS